LATVIDMIEIKKSCSEFEYVRCGFFDASPPEERANPFKPEDANAEKWPVLNGV
jgi:hypothetical protein